MGTAALGFHNAIVIERKSKRRKTRLAADGKSAYSRQRRDAVSRRQLITDNGQLITGRKRSDRLTVRLSPFPVPNCQLPASSLAFSLSMIDDPDVLQDRHSGLPDRS